jgi:hypothetical protein
VRGSLPVEVSAETDVALGGLPYLRSRKISRILGWWRIVVVGEKGTVGWVVVRSMGLTVSLCH